MGVVIETITPGDGGNSLSCFTAYYPISFTQCLVHCKSRFLYFLLFSGQTFPKKGQHVVVHYVGKWGGIVGIVKITLLRGALRLEAKCFV